MNVDRRIFLSFFPLQLSFFSLFPFKCSFSPQHLGNTLATLGHFGTIFSTTFSTTCITTWCLLAKSDQMKVSNKSIWSLYNCPTPTLPHGLCQCSPQVPGRGLGSRRRSGFSSRRVWRHPGIRSCRRCRWIQCQGGRLTPPNHCCQLNKISSVLPPHRVDITDSFFVLLD